MKGVRQLYCSKACFGLMHRTAPLRTCEICGKEIPRRQKDSYRFCSKACYGESQRAERPECARYGCNRPVKSAQAMFCSKACYRMRKRVPNEPLRERFLELHARGLITAGEIARRMEWLQPKLHGKPGQRADDSRVMRTLGLRRESGQRNRGRYRETILSSTAVRIGRALHMDPFEIGV